MKFILFLLNGKSTVVAAILTSHNRHYCYHSSGGGMTSASPPPLHQQQWRVRCRLRARHWYRCFQWRAGDVTLTATGMDRAVAGARRHVDRHCYVCVGGGREKSR